MSKRYLYLMLLALMPLGAMAQQYDQNTDIEEDGAPPRKGYRFNYFLDVSAPHIVFNPANAQAFDGIAMVNTAFNFRIVKGFSVGAYARYAGFNVYNAQMGMSNPLSTTISGGLNLMYEVPIGERFAYIPTVNVGFGWIMYQHINKPPKDVNDSPRYQIYDVGVCVQNTHGFYYYAKRNKRIGIGLIVGLNYFSHEFSLKDTGMDKDSQLTPYSDQGPTLHVNVGLGFVTNLGKILGM